MAAFNPLEEHFQAKWIPVRVKKCVKTIGLCPLPVQSERKRLEHSIQTWAGPVSAAPSSHNVRIEMQKAKIDPPSPVRAEAGAFSSEMDAGSRQEAARK
jgi:hypothetical protein